MKRKEFIFIFLLFFFITAIFFYKTFLHGYVPMAGDLLISEYNPWKTYSYAGYNPGSYPNKAQYFDVIRQMYPWKTFSTNTLKSGHMPLWNPYNFSGAPLLANFQSAVLYPFTILYFFLPSIIAWTILIFLQPFLAGIFTYSFTRKIGLSKIASIFSGICFAFSSFFSVWLEYNTVGHVIVWLPLMLLSVEHLLEKRAYGNTSIRWVIVFIFSLVSSLFAGHIQVFGYICIFLIAYIIFKVTTVSENKKKLFLSFGLLFFITLGIGAIQIIPGLELISFSARSAHSYSDIINKILIQPWQVIMFIVPDFFGNPATRNYWLSDTYVGKVTSIGIVPLFFIFLTFAKWKNLLTRFFLGSIIIILLFVTVNPLTMFLYKVNLPFFSSSSPAMGVFLLCFCLSILTGFGIDIYRKEKISLKRFIITSHILIVLFLFLWGIILFVPRMVHADWVEHFAITKRNLLYTTIILAITTGMLTISFFKRKILFGVLIILLCIQIFDTWRFFTKFNPFVPQELIFPQTPVTSFIKNKKGIDRFWGYKGANIEANFATQYNIFSPEGYDPLYPKRYAEFIQSAKDGHIPTQFTDQTRSDAIISSEKFTFFHQRVLNLLGIKYILDRPENGSTEKIFPPEMFQKIYADNRWYVYENLHALPRAFIVFDYKIFHSGKEFEKIFFNKTFHPGKTILLEEDLHKKLSATIGSVGIQSYLPDTIQLQTQTNGNALLFLSDNYYSGWKAFVDGKETKIYRADYTFRAVYIPQGKHKITFTFDSSSFKIGILVSLLSLGISIGWMFLLNQRKFSNSFS